MLAQAVVIFSLWTGEPRFVALLDYPYQMDLQAYRPQPGEARLYEDRDQFIAEVFDGPYPDPIKLREKTHAAMALLASTAAVQCPVGVDVP